MTIKFVRRVREGGTYDPIRFYFHFKVQVADDKNLWHVVLNEAETEELYAELCKGLGYEHGKSSREWRQAALQEHERMIDGIERRAKKILRLIDREPERCCYCSEED